MTRALAYLSLEAACVLVALVLYAVILLPAHQRKRRRP